MKYRRQDAKDYARAHMKGLWAAALTPFAPDHSLDEAGLRANLRHWYRDLKLDGLFMGGKQAEFASLSLPERKRTFAMAVEEAASAGPAHGTIISCSDQNIDTVVDLMKYSQGIGADYVVIHAPVLHFGAHTDDTLYEYYRYLSEQADIGIALWSHPDSGYLMSPELCARIAELPTVVAIKYSVPREMYAKLTHLAGDKLLVSTASEEEWLDNIIELKWQVYLCSTPPFLIQTKTDQRMREYTDLALKGDIAGAKRVWNGLEPVRKALRGSRPEGKPQAHQKYWQELLGQAGGPVRRPLLQLTEAEKARTREAFAACGLGKTVTQRAA